MKKWKEFSEEELLKIVKNSNNKKEIAEKLGYSTRSNYSRHVSEMLEYYNFDISHLQTKKDLTGQRFGKLTVIKEGESSGRVRQWYCNCDCGKTDILVRHGNLTSGNTKSCGCLGRETIKSTQRKNLKGQKIGYWEIIDVDEGKSKNGTYWFCKCTLCNSEQIHSIPTTNLLSGKTLSCGCHISSLKTIKIEEFLKNKQLNFSKEHSFNDLKSENNVVLRFDFAILNQNNLPLGVIEYQGQQHYIPNLSWGGLEGFEKQKDNDSRKRKYCNKHNIKLCEIPYWFSEEKIIEELEEFLNDIYGEQK